MLPPPVFPDVAHVANGCYVSAVIYLAKFSAVFPAERGEPAAFVLPNADGSNQPHTLALISWRGEWWARDEYFGVVPLGCSSAAPWSPRLAQLRADAGFRRRAEFLRRQAADVRRETAPAQGGLTPEWRLAEILSAQRLLPFPSEIHWRPGDRSPIPFLYFHLAGDSFAVYDPAKGTASALSPVRDGAALVAAVAERMGYGRHRSPPESDFAASRLAAGAPAREPAGARSGIRT
jgi:hypothetical protein